VEATAGIQVEDRKTLKSRAVATGEIPG